jgi:hypothetical protein
VFLPLVLMKQKIAAFHFSLPPVAISCTIHFLSFLYLDDSLHQRYHQLIMIQNQKFFLGKNRVTPRRQLDSNHHKIVSCPSKHHNKNTSNPPHHFHLAYHPKSWRSRSCFIQGKKVNLFKDSQWDEDEQSSRISCETDQNPFKNCID